MMLDAKENLAECTKSSVEHLCINLCEQIENDFNEIINSDYPIDVLNECCNNAIPDNCYILAQMLANNTSLSEVDDLGCVEDTTDIFKIIQCSIYEYLSAAAASKLHDLSVDKINEVGSDIIFYNSKIEKLLLELDDLGIDTDKNSDQIEILENKIEILETKISDLEDLESKLSDL